MISSSTSETSSPSSPSLSFKCSRRGQSRELILSWLDKSICRGQLKHAMYCAAELDLSGWSLFLWKRLFWIGWAHIGLANALVPMSLLDLYERWLDTLKQLGSTLEESAECVKARCIIMLAVNWLTHEKKNQLILHCSTACIFETTGCLTDDDWHQKLGTNYKLKISLAALRLKSCAAESKAIVCLCRSMLENDEHRATRMVNLFYVWGKSRLVWIAMQKLCDVNTQELFGWANTFIGSYQKVWEFCLEEDDDDDEEDDSELFIKNVDKERLPLFQIVLLMIPGRNFRHMFPTGIGAKSLSEDRIRVWEKQAADVYAADHSKITMPSYVWDKNTKVGCSRGKDVEDYLNSALRVTNFANGVPDPFGYYDRAHRELLASEKRYGNQHTTTDAFIRLRESGAIQDGLKSSHPRDYVETLKQQPPPPEALVTTTDSRKRKEFVTKIVGNTATPPSPKRVVASSPRRETKPRQSLKADVIKNPSTPLSSTSGYYANYCNHHVFVDGPFFCSNNGSIAMPHLTAIHTIKQLFHGMDVSVNKSTHGLQLLEKPLRLRLQLLNTTTAIFSLTKIPWNKSCDPQKEDVETEVAAASGEMYMDWEEEEAEKKPSVNTNLNVVAITPTIMNSENRPEVHIRFLSLVAFRYTFRISCQASDDILLDSCNGNVYSLREREMTGGKPPQWKQLLPMEWSRYAWENYLKKKIFKQNSLILKMLQQRCLRWKQILEVPDIIRAVFDPIHMNVMDYSQNLDRLANGGPEAWLKMGEFC